MEYIDIIRDNSENRSPVSWWPKFAFHYTDVTNAVSILSSGFLYSRADATHLRVMKNDNASRQVTEFLRIFDTDSFDTIKEGQTARVTEHLALAREMEQARKHFMKRIRLLRKHKIYRQRKGDHRVFMLFLLIGMY